MTSLPDDICENYHKGQDTSVQANVSIQHQKEQLRFEILKLVQASGDKGITCEEVEHLTGMKHQTASARISELLADKQIHYTNVRRYTSTGRPARVYYYGPPPVEEETIFDAS